MQALCRLVTYLEDLAVMFMLCIHKVNGNKLIMCKIIIILLDDK